MIPASRTLAALSVLALMSIVAGPVCAGLIVNPGFELGPSPTPAQSTPLGAGSTALTGWVVTRNAIDYCGYIWETLHGERSVALNGTGPGGIAQTFATSNGAAYVVQFFMAGDPFSSPAIKRMRVSAANQSQDYEFDISHGWPWDMGWALKTFAFSANGSSTTLEFYSLDAGATGPAIDSVIVNGPSTTVPVTDAAGIALESPYPNPSRGACTVAFAIPAPAPVRLSVFDMQGREIAVLAERHFEAGRHVIPWGDEIAGSKVQAGIYFIRLVSPGETRVRKAVFAR